MERRGGKERSDGDERGRPMAHLRRRTRRGRQESEGENNLE
jgi:hypothetical protein